MSRSNTNNTVASKCITDVLMNTIAKPYLKLFKLIHHSYSEGAITEWEAIAMEEELELLVNGNNYSHNTIPRSYINN